MTDLLFREDPYLRRCSATVTAVRADQVAFDRSIFYPRGGGQPGDSGSCVLADGTRSEISDTIHGEGGEVWHQVGDGTRFDPGLVVELHLDWTRRYAHMRMHTGLHLLGAVIPHGVTGGNISAGRSRLDFDMQDTLDKVQVEEALNRLVAEDHPVQSRWISQQELAGQPELVRTMSVRPPANVARLRLLEIPGVDLQPCGGTHVRSTAEVGPLRIGKVEKKGRHNRRVHVEFA